MGRKSINYSVRTIYDMMLTEKEIESWRENRKEEDRREVRQCCLILSHSVLPSTEEQPPYRLCLYCMKAASVRIEASTVREN